MEVSKNNNIPYNKRHYCCVCSNYRGKVIERRTVTLHRFPANKILRNSWLKRIKVVSPRFQLNEKNDRLCSEHFVGGVYRRGQKENNVPSVFILHDGTAKSFRSSSVSPETILTSPEPEEPMQEEDWTTLADDPEPLSCSTDISTEVVSVAMHDYIGSIIATPCHSLNKDTQTNFNNKVHCHSGVQTVSAITKSIGTQTDFVQFQSDTHSKKSCGKPEMKSVGIQALRPEISFEDIENSEDKCMFYTGLPNGGMFKSLFNGMDDAEQQTQRNGFSSKKGRPRSLRLIDEFFLVLMRLRLGLLLEDLAQRFHISKSTCSNITNHWIVYLSVKLSFLVTWPSRSTIDETMPKKFKRKYPKCRVIIDCTEIKTETPQSLANKTLMYSHYKSHMTYKALLGITPSGYISFASDLWTGGISDKQITLNSGILHLCEFGDAIMADKGFLISDLTTPKGISLIIPPLKLKRFSRREIEETRRIANLRIDVERAMERVKNFRILQGVLPITLSHQATNIWKICVCLSNILPPLVHDEDDY